MEEWQRKLAEAVEEIAPFGPVQIAQMFEEGEIHGHMASAPHCPVANWATRISRDYGGPKITAGNRVWPYLSAASEWRLRMPDSLVDFVRAFDQGRFPQLVKRP